ncbi:uncharacterized protein K452DRAFT_321534 [Aplosporella prunicola CBS 121167]|uniref:Uncharacterized protein n=1 Tax=Aplosporella prunicola CBS 121167 TaxID=1176127 RepID=A0A6A6B4G4_9PEZI|nr:uncharacterized protein K452DRAFT_321534 [Aplosporella prunicola CBS 121167]KAF2137857.1 hypothetical protein K452DRAFT_321534 [Aplosporella prunicola CBS 121167]
MLSISSRSKDLSDSGEACTRFWRARSGSMRDVPTDDNVVPRVIRSQQVSIEGCTRYATRSRGPSIDPPRTFDRPQTRLLKRPRISYEAFSAKFASSAAPIPSIEELPSPQPPSPAPTAATLALLPGKAEEPQTQETAPITTTVGSSSLPGTLYKATTPDIMSTPLSDTDADGTNTAMAFPTNSNASPTRRAGANTYSPPRPSPLRAMETAGAEPARSHSTIAAAPLRSSPPRATITVDAALAAQRAPDTVPLPPPPPTTDVDMVDELAAPATSQPAPQSSPQGAEGPSSASAPPTSLPDPDGLTMYQQRQWYIDAVVLFGAKTPNSDPAVNWEYTVPWAWRDARLDETEEMRAERKRMWRNLREWSRLDDS